MPIHDWTRVNAGIFHAFHQRWIVYLCDAMNAGVLPADFYALPEQIVGGVIQATSEAYASKANHIAVRHPLGDVVAILEIVSPGNKQNRHAMNALVDKVVGFLRRGIHVLVVDLFPPMNYDPNGIHKAIWDEICDEPFELTPDEPLILVSYCANPLTTAYIEPTAVGRPLAEMPIFLSADYYVRVPLEATYETTWSMCPQPMKQLLAPD